MSESEKLTIYLIVFSVNQNQWLFNIGIVHWAKKGHFAMLQMRVTLQFYSLRSGDRRQPFGFTVEPVSGMLR